MNTEYIEALLSGLKQAKDAINQWTEYKSQVEAALKEALAIPGQEELVEQLRAKAVGSILMRPYNGLEVKFSVALSFDQDKIAEVVRDHFDLVGSVIHTKYEPASAKTVFTLLKSDNPIASNIEQALNIVKRGPYFSLSEPKEK